MRANIISLFGCVALGFAGIDLQAKDAPKDSAAQAKPLQSTPQTAHLNHPFTVTIFKPLPNSKFLVSKIDSNYVSLIKREEGGDTVVFSFMPIRVGTVEVFIDHVEAATTDKPTRQERYVQYEIKILPSGEGEEPNKAPSESTSAAQKPRAVDSKAQRDLGLLRQYAKDGVRHLADKTYNQFVSEHGYANAWSVEAIRAMEGFWFAGKQHELARKELQQVLDAESKALPASNRAWLHYRLGRHQLADNRFEEASVHFHILKNQHKDGPYYSEGLFWIGEVFYLEKRHPNAVRAYEFFLKANKAAQQKHKVAYYDLALWRLATMRETVRSVLNLRQAASHYSTLVKDCPFSEHVNAAQKRFAYLRDNFLDITR